MRQALIDAIDNLDAATAAFATASAAQNTATQAYDAALADINAAQTAVDAVLKQIRDEQPADSDWKRQQRAARDGRNAS